MLAERDAWSLIVEPIAADQSEALIELANATREGIRLHLMRRVGHLDHLENLIEEVYAVAAQGIKSGALNRPSGLISNLREIANQIAHRHIKIR